MIKNEDKEFRRKEKEHDKIYYEKHHKSEGKKEEKRKKDKERRERRKIEDKVLQDRLLHSQEKVKELWGKLKNCTQKKQEIKNLSKSCLNKLRIFLKKVKKNIFVELEQVCEGYLQDPGACQDLTSLDLSKFESFVLEYSPALDATTYRGTPQVKPNNIKDGEIVINGYKQHKKLNGGSLTTKQKVVGVVENSICVIKTFKILSSVFQHLQNGRGKSMVIMFSPSVSLWQIKESSKNLFVLPTGRPPTSATMMTSFSNMTLTKLNKCCLMSKFDVFSTFLCAFFLDEERIIIEYFQLKEFI